jgi:transcriptional regulator with XRE-family HTH domain
MLADLRRSRKQSERDAAAAAGVARETLRACERDPRSVKVEHLESIAQLYSRRVLLAVVPQEPAASELSTTAISLAVVRDGFDSWKIHFMDFVDEFRRRRDVRLLLLPPVNALDERLRALLSSIVVALCEEADVETPDWAQQEHFLQTPWFVSGIESLKASALVESAPPFRRNNIFVQENFLRRA